MNEQIFSSLRGLPRQTLEDLAIRAMVEMREDRREMAPNRYFLAALSGFALGAAIATTGFLIGAAVR